MTETLTDFPPENIRGFLQLSAGEWLALRSVMEPEGAGPIQREGKPTDDIREQTQEWHLAERGNLRCVFLDPQRTEEWGGMEIALPDQSILRLIFAKDGSVVIGTLPGLWKLCSDGSLELEVTHDSRIVKERIWFSKPNLRLRCTLEQFTDGTPGRASFSSEIRRVTQARGSTTPHLAN